VVSRSSDEGELATLGVPVITLDGNGDLEIKARLSELDVIALHIGDHAEVLFDALAESNTASATISHIDPSETTVDSLAGYGITLTLSAPVPELRAGMSADVLVRTVEREHALAAQVGYIRRDGEHAFVQVQKNGRIYEMPVQLGITIPGLLIEIVSGVHSGDVLIPYDAE
jgi:multidrug efflux pump subunit AcrA (membrane-fusion protein)